jgi:hypothetical protein
MAEFLVRIRDKEGHNVGLLGEREVVSVCEDGWKWSRIELSNPDWRILKVPGMTVEEGEVFTMPEPVDTTRYIQRRRAFKIDVTVLPASIQEKITDDRRLEPALELEKTALELSKTARTPIPLDGVIGPVDVIVKSMSKAKK